jgi:hypothetical protein
VAVGTRTALDELLTGIPHADVVQDSAVSLFLASDLDAVESDVRDREI